MNTRPMKTTTLAQSPPPTYSAVEDAARKSKVCICGKSMNEGLRPQDEGSPVCWDCFKYRTDVTPLKYFQSSYDEWVKYLRNSGIRQCAAL